MKPRWHRWIVWLLPFLVARALVPVGFMLSVGDGGGLALTFCPSVTPISLSAAAAHHDASHQGAHVHDSESNQDQQHHSDHFRASDTSVCPFGVIAGACTDTSGHAARLFVDSTSQLPPLYAAPPETKRLIRADRIRGPPTVLLT